MTDNKPPLAMLNQTPTGWELIRDSDGKVVDSDTSEEAIYTRNRKNYRIKTISR